MDLAEYLSRNDSQRWWLLDPVQQRELFEAAIDRLKELEVCPPGKKTDVYGQHITFERALSLPWRCGTTVADNIYAEDEFGWSRPLGQMKTPELGSQVVADHNRQLKAREASRDQN